MKVLSLFDGIACGYEALLRAGIKVEKYYASEIDKYAIQIATKNHPDIVEIGDVCNVKGEDYKDIDLLIGGSPCQGFSMAGKMLNFDDPRSKLFFEYVRILKEMKPKFFLLENVKMKKEFIKVINEHLFGIEPVLIDSSLLSAQHRERLYRVGKLQDDGTYTKVDIPQPEDKKIMLKDVIIPNVTDEEYYLTEKQIEKIKENLRSKGKQLNPIESIIEKMTYPSRIKQIQSLNIKSPTLCSAMGTGGNNVPIICRGRPQMPYEPGKRTLEYKAYTDKCPTLTENCASGDQKNIVAIAYAPGRREFEQQGWKEDKSPTICARDYKDPKIVSDGICLRKLTPEECEMLQTLKPGYTSGVSKTQRYKQLGNGWTVNVITHIFTFINKQQGQQQTS